MKNNLLNEKPVYTGRSRTPTRMYLYNYDELECQKHEAKRFAKLVPNLEDKSMHWLQVHGLSHTETIHKVCEYYHINFLVLQDILASTHVAKIEEYPKFNFIILKLLHKDNEAQELCSHQVCLVQGENFLITFLEQEDSFFDPIVRALYDNILNIRSRGSDYLLSVLMNQIISDYNVLVNEISDSLEDMEEELLSITEKTDIGKRIQLYRRQYLVLKKAITPLKEQYSRLQHPQGALIREQTRLFFNDVNDHLQMAAQTTDVCREILSSLVDLYISNNDLRMNNIMKRLTAVSTIFIPLTFVVGVWGMNFSIMPELAWEYGYFAAWVVMILVGVLVSLYLKKKDWY